LCRLLSGKTVKVDVLRHEPVEGTPFRIWFKEELSRPMWALEGDILVHPVIDLDGDKAKGSGALHDVLLPRTGQSLFWVQGFYDMDYVREKGKWKISVMGGLRNGPAWRWPSDGSVVNLYKRI